ncbi:MAG: N-acyl-L-amino acid amidohydrolase [Candidatus Marinimicrobia bacterium]|nr:N-acyl-L-amino acid amidohydrolase [Candidatus Neomarinimicrobiota bacterium]
MNKIFIVYLIFLNALNANNYDNQIESLALKYEKQVIEWRHWFHANPELSNREFNTSKRIAKILKKIGYKPKTGIAKTGVVAILDGGKPGPVVALRADIDGLPVKERSNLDWASNKTGEYNGETVPVMHACGHDTHISILLGVAKILYELKEQIPGKVKFIFQPAEEGAPEGEEGGAKLMVEEGVLYNPNVDAIFGLHISSHDKVGTISIKPEGIMAAVNSFRIDIKGRQAHGSAPWNSVDPIVTAAQMINNIQTIVSRNMKLTEAAAVVTIGAIHGGVRSNIIPEDLYMLGTIRTLDESMKIKIHKRIKEIVKKTADTNNAEATINIDEGYPVTFNDPKLYSRMLPTFTRVAGEENVKIMKAITGAEDFSFFQKEVPGLYFFIGGIPENIDISQSADHHTPDFFVDDSGMLLGMKTMATLALDYLLQ